LNGDPGAVAVDRAAAELRAGRVVDLVGADARWRLASVELLDENRLARLQQNDGGTLSLWITAERARTLGLGLQATALRCDGAWALQQLRALAGLTPDPVPGLAGYRAAAAAVELQAGFSLAKRTRLVPALVGAQVATADPGVLEVRVHDIRRHGTDAAIRMQRIADARVPLADMEDCRFVLFRDIDADVEHLAVVLGQPSRLDPVPVRLHSSCLTGDLMGSLRCDCGEQLRTAVRAIGGSGGGVLLYLSQEGRGIGLANKLRAYGLQDGGLDTIEADHHLGFSADERDFSAAAEMLRSLDVLRIELYTNNPRKLEAMRSAGVDVVQRRPLVATVNVHNARYVQTKRERAGHL
jgi:GTP cyclohydrolase II